MYKACILKLFLYSLLFCLGYCQTIWCNMSTSTSSAGATASHTYTCVFQNITIGTNSYMYTNYSSNWDLSSLSRGNTNDYCQTGCTNSSITAISTSNNVKISNQMPNSFTTGYFSFRITLNNIANPAYTTTENIAIGFYTSTNALIFSDTISTNIVAALMICTATFPNSLIQASNTYTFAVTPSTVALPKTGSMKITFPSIWKNSLSGSALTYTGCTSASGISCSASGPVITATNLFSTATTSSQFTFSISSITNPGTVEPNSELLFEYFNSGGVRLSYCSVTISSLTSSELVSPSFSIKNKVISFNFVNTVVPARTDQMLIVFPPEVYIQDLVKIFITAFVNGSNYTDNSLPNIILTNNSVSFYPKLTVTANWNFDFTNLYLLRPVNSSSISIYMRRAGYQYSNYSYCCLFMNSSQTMIISVSLTNYKLKGLSNYIVTFVPTYYDIYQLIVTFSSFSMINSTTYSCYLQSLTTSSQTVCIVISPTQIKVTLTNTSTSLANILGFSSNYTLIIVDLTNPSSINATIKVSSNYLSSQELQNSNTFQITYLTTLILNSAIIPSNYKVGSIANYKFVINNTNILQANSIMHIYFPLSYTLTNSSSCQTNAVSSVCQLENTTYIKFILPNSIINSYTLGSYDLVLTNVINPNSLEPTSSFTISLESANNSLQSINDGLVVKMTTLSDFTSLNIIPSTNISGKLAIYTINFAHNLTFSASNSVAIKFQLPPSYTLVSCSLCTSFQTLPITASNNSVVIDAIYNPQKSYQSSPINVSLLVDGYISIFGSFSPTFVSDTLIYSLTQNSTYLGQPVDIRITIITFPISAQYLVIIIPSEYSRGPIVLSSPNSINFTYTNSSYTFNCSITNILQKDVIILIKGLINPNQTISSFWQLFTYSNYTTIISQSTSFYRFTAVCGSNCKDCINSTYCLSCYSNNLVNNQAYLNSSNLCSASCNSTQFLQNRTCYSCNSSCETCSMYSSNCTSCSTGYYLLGSNCLSQCPDTYFPLGQTCSPCVSNCLACNSSSICLTCTGNYIRQSNYSCSLSCPPGYYNYSKICSTCPNNCTTCNSNGCVTCQSSFYLTTFTFKQCLSACPTGYYISNDGLRCEACQSTCKSCSISSYNCTSCFSTGNITLYNYTCTANCPSNTYKDEMNQCQTCSSSCLTCDNFNNCTSCTPPLLFYSPGHQCISACISNTIQIGNNCVQCIYPCLTCSGSITYCITCAQNYFLFNNTCTLDCVAPLIPYSGICSNCSSPCANCDSVNRTSCTSCIFSYLLFSSSCYQSCPKQTYANTATTCALCTPPCYQCLGGPTICVSCFNGSFLLGGTCYSPCPPSFYQKNSSCVVCEPQCTSCAYTQSDECSSCSSLIYYYNPLTYHCTSSCISPYFIKTGQMVCQTCQLPCKDCLVQSNRCIDCYSGYFLKSNLCITNCGAGFYSDTITKTCIQCSNPCATCDNQKCFTCQANSYFYNGGCYGTCPPQAPYIYGIYCRNCLKSNCIKCNDEGSCTICEASFYSYEGACVGSCPSEYEPDIISQSQCVIKPQVAYFKYIKYIEHKKILIIPSTVILIISLILLYFAENKLLFIAFLLGIPQVISLAQLTLNYLHQWAQLAYKTLPEELMYIVFGLQVVSSIIYIIVIGQSLMKIKKTRAWLDYGSNQFRTYIIIAFSFINKQFFFILFSGIFNIPFTAFELTVDRIFYICHSLYFIIDIGVFTIGFIIIFIENTASYNYKLFYSALDIVIIYGFTIIYQVIFLLFIGKQVPPSEYSKYVLPKVSCRSLPALSEPGQQIQTPVINNLHRSNSNEDIFESKEMKDVDFLSQLDPDDYFDQTPYMKLDQVEGGLEKGDFRKKNKKKRGQRRLGKMDLDVIEQLEQEKQEKINEKYKKKRKNAKEDVGGLKNFIYWKKPKQKKIAPAAIFKQNENQIMSRIREKQSEFDSITQNDIIFNDYEQSENSSQQDYERQQDSRRALQKGNYENYFNLNYASRKHLI